MLARKPKHRIFDYMPRYYKPEDDPSEKSKRKLNFRNLQKSRRKTKSPIIWLVFILIIIYFYLKFSS